MAEDFLTTARAAANSTVSPQGMSQDQAQPRDDEGFLSTAKKWYGGANTEGTANGYDTPFYQTFFDQLQTAADEGRMHTLYAQPDFTGVVTWDQEIGDQKYTFGDIYESGQRVGNVYDAYADDPATADVLMADLTLDARTKQQVFKGEPADAAGNLAQEVQRKREQTTAEVAKYGSSLAYQDEVEDRTEAALENGEGAWGSVLAGAGGGAAVGAGIGSVIPGIGTAIGGLVGTALGGIGGFLNRDQITHEAARIGAQMEIAGETQNPAAQATEFVTGAGALGMKILDPLGNLTQGIYDEVVGDGGDAKSEYYARDETTGELMRPGWMTGVSTVASLGSAVGWAGPAALALFQGSMLATIGGQVGGLAVTGGSTFDVTRGGFDNIFTNDAGEFDPGSAAAGIANIGIDVVQLGFGRGLSSKAFGSRQAVAAQTGGAIEYSTTTKVMAALLPGSFTANAVAKGERIIEQAGMKFTVNEAGKATGKKLSMQVLAPSELVQLGNVRVQALRMKARGDGAIDADDLFRAATRLSQGAMPMTAALVNGFGEASEEIAQAYLEPISHNAPLPGLEEAFEAGLAGFSMGAGMSLGFSSGARSATKQDRMFAQAYVVRGLTGGKELTREEFDKMSKRQQREAAFVPEQLDGVAKAEAQKLLTDLTPALVANTPELAKLEKSLRTIRDIASGAINESTDMLMKISSHNSAEVPNVATEFSLKTAFGALQRHARGLQLQIDDLRSQGVEEADPEFQALVQAMQQAELVLQYLAGADQEMDAFVEAGSLGQIRALVEEVNEFLAAAYRRSPGQVEADGQPLTPEQTMARARAVTLLNGRYPLDSDGFLAQMPQVDETLTRFKGHNGMLVSQATLAITGGDFDGDQYAQFARERMTQAQWMKLRTGQQFMENGSPKIGVRNIEKRQVFLLSEAMAPQANVVLADQARTAMKMVKDGVREILPDLPGTELDEILTAYENRVRAGDAKASVMLIQELYNAPGYADRIQAQADALLEPIPLVIDDITHQAYEWFHDKHARSRTGPESLSDRTASPHAQTRDTSSSELVRGARPGDTMAMTVPGATMIRMFQKLKQSAINSNVESDMSEFIPLLAQIQEAYRTLTQKSNRTVLEELNAKDEIAGGALMSLRAMAGEQGSAGMSSMAKLAMLKVPNLDSTGRWFGNDRGQKKEITLVQWLLREELRTDRIDKAALWEQLPELQSKHARLNRLLGVDKEHDADTMAGLAFVEVFAPVQLGELLGDAAQTLGAGITVEQKFKQYRQEGPEGRKRAKDLLSKLNEYKGRVARSDAPYDLSEVMGSNLSPFRVVVDVLMSAGNTSLFMDEAGNARGELARRASTVHNDLIEGLTFVSQTFIDALGNANLPRTAEGVSTLMSQNSKWAARVLELLPDQLANSLYSVQDVAGRDTIVVAPWVREMLTMDPEAGAMHMWRSLLMSEWRMLTARSEHANGLDVERMSNRVHRLMYHLGHSDPTGAALVRFVKDLNAATSLPDFIRTLNNTYRMDEAPYTTWINDVAEYDPAKPNGGWASASTGASVGETIKAFRDSSEMLHRNLNKLHNERTSDDISLGRVNTGFAKISEEGGLVEQTLPNGLKALELPARLANDADAKMAQAWDYAVESARGSMSVVGPNAMQVFAMGALLGFYANASDKGLSPAHSRQIGEEVMYGDAPGYAMPYIQRFEAMTGLSLDSIAANPSLILDGGRTMGDDGTVFEWPKLDSAFLADLMESMPEARPLIKMIIFPTVYDSTPTGAMGVQFVDRDTTVAKLLRQSRRDRLFKDSASSKMRHITEVSMRAKRYDPSHPLERYVTEVLLAQTTGRESEITPAEAATTQRRAFLEIDEVLRIVGELSARGIDMEAVRNGVRSAMVDRRRKSLTAEDKTLAALRLAYVDSADKIRVLDKARELIEEGKVDEANKLLNSANMAEDRLLRRLLGTNEYDRVVADYSLPDPADQTQTDRVKWRLAHYVTQNSMLGKSVPGAMLAVTALREADPAGTLRLPRLEEGDWELISLAVIAAELETRSGLLTEGAELPLFPSEKLADQRRYYDDSYFYLLDPVLNPESALVQGARDVYVASGRGTMEYTVEDLISKLTDTVLDVRRLGTWSTEVAQATIAETGRLASASVEPAIKGAGLATPQQAALSQATRWSYDVPHPDLASTISLSMADLNAKVTTVTQKPIAAFVGWNPDGSPQTSVADADFALLDLEGRYASDATVSYTDVSGREHVIPIWRAVPLNPNEGQDSVMRPRQLGQEFKGTSEETRALQDSGYRSITLEELRAAVALALPAETLYRHDSLRVNLSIFHPDTLPSDMDVNNVVFEGASTRLNNPVTASGNATMMNVLIPEAQNTALSAMKKNAESLRINPVPTFQAVQMMEAGWESDLAAVIRRKARHDVTHDPGSGPIDSILFNASVKRFKMMHVVRGTDSEGKVVVWNAEKVIGYQRAHPGEALPFTNPELVVIPEANLRDLLGDPSDHGASVLGRLDRGVDPMDVEVYTGLDEQTILARLPGLLQPKRGVRDLLKTRLQGVQAATTNVVRGPEGALNGPAYLAGVARLAALRAPVEEDRASSRAFQNRRNQDIENAARWASEALNTMSKQVNFVAAGFGPFAQHNPNDEVLSKFMVDRIMNALSLDRLSSAWVVQDGTTASPATGVIRPAALDPETRGYKEPKRENHVVLGDVAYLDVSSFNRDGRTYDEQVKRLTRMVDLLMSRGATIIIAEADGTHNLTVELGAHMADSGYQSVGGSNHVFEPNLEGVRRATADARAALASATRAVSAESRFASFISKDIGTDENAAWITDPGAVREVSTVVDLVPTEPYPRFTVPLLPQHVTAVKSVLENMSTEEIEALARRSGATEAEQITEFARAFERMVAGWSDVRAFPRAGSTFGMGDMIPFFNESSREILIYRHGYQAPPTPSALGAQLAERADKRTPGIAAYLPNPVPGGKATIHEGTVEEFMGRGGYGMQVRMRVNLQALLAKMVKERSGMKLLTGPKPEGTTLPSHGFFQNWGIEMMADPQSEAAKEALSVDSIESIGDAVTFLGFDFAEPLARTLFSEISDWNSLAEQEKQAYRQRLLTLLNELASKTNVSEAQVSRLLNVESEVTNLSTALWNVVSDLTYDDAMNSNWAKDLQESDNAEAIITRKVLAWLMTSGVKPSWVLNTGGFNAPNAREGRAYSRRLPLLLTRALDNADPAVTKYFVDRANEQMYNPNPTQERYWFDKEWQLHIKTADGREMVGRLSFSEVHSASTNPVHDALAFERNDRQGYSQTTAAVSGMMLDATTVLDRKFTDVVDFVTKKGAAPLEKPEDVWAMLRPQANGDVGIPWRMLTRAELEYVRVGRERNLGYRQPLNMKRWSKQDAAKVEREIKLIADTLGLTEKQRSMVDGWIRQQLGRPLDGELGMINASDALRGIGYIKENLSNHRLPTFGGVVPRIHFNDLQFLYSAQRASRSTWQLWTGKPVEGEVPTVASTWEQWKNVALGENGTGSEKFDPAFRHDYDSFTHTFIEGDGAFAGLSVTDDDLVRENLLDPELQQVLLSIDPDAQASLHDMILVDPRLAGLEDLFGVEATQGPMKLRRTSRDRHEVELARIDRWRKNNGVPQVEQTTLTDFAENGKRFRSESGSANAAMRIAVNLRAGTALNNPLLWASAVVETGVRQVLDSSMEFLSGEGTGLVSQGLSRVAPDLVRYTPEQMQMIDNLVKILGSNPDFKSMIYTQMLYQQPKLHNASWLENATGKLARFGAMMQDPNYKMRADIMAKRYIISALGSIMSDPTSTTVTVESFVRAMRTDAHWLERTIPEYHQMATNAVANARSLKPTPLSLALRGFVDPLTENPNAAIAMTSTLALKLPLMFATYGMNVLTTITGLQGPMTLLAAGLEGRKNIFGRWSSFAANREYRPEEDGTFDMSEVFEGVDLSKAFIQSGLTHTALFAFGLMAGGLNLTGEDDEDKRRRRAAAYQGAGHVYDPRQIENDFRNAEAIFLDSLPPFLSSMFKTNSGDKSMINMHWMLKQFVSPLMGIERFLETGDWRQVLWGFQDAASAFPLINFATYDRALAAYTELQQASVQAELKGTEKDLQDAMYFGIAAVSSLESMLFEFSFLNTLYVGFDKYDRDPWKIPMTDSEGNIFRDALNVPQSTQALQPYVDPETGEIREGYVGRDWLDAQIHGLTENRAVLAGFMSLFTGLGGSDYNRYNMPPKVQKVDKQKLTEQEAMGLVLSVFDEESGMEVLTDNGARAVFDGIYHGAVSLDSPALEGLFIPYEMRGRIATQLTEELYQEAADLGLTGDKADAYVEEIWYGSSYNPYSVPLRDIVYSKDISYTAQQRYNQLNTTYVIGPDGMPWATGIKRDSLENVFGFVPLNKFYQGETGNMGVDERLNSVDDIAGTNTGIRALERIDDSWMIPTDAQIAQDIIDAIEEASKKPYTPDQYRNGYGYGGYGGGGGGGGGYYTRLQTPDRMDVPYGNTAPYLNARSPYTKRSRIYRERFTSQRGRLKPWQ